MFITQKTIFELIDIKLEDSEETIKAKYISQLHKLHPNKGGDNKKCIELMEAYKQYLFGKDCYNCLEVILVNEMKPIICRCGYKYENEGKIGIQECLCCSCYIYIEEPPKMIHSELNF